jgi:hypothetical protein
VAAHERLKDVIAFVQEYLEADAAVARAALSEPDDDTYLATQARLTGMFAPGDGSAPLVPLESRWAVPGRTSPHASLDPGDSIGPAALLAVCRLEGDEPRWVAFTSSKRDREAVSMSDALLVERGDDGFAVAGRAGLSPFSAGFSWEAAGGAPVPVDAPVAEAQLLRAPVRAEHAEWLAAKVRR